MSINIVAFGFDENKGGGLSTVHTAAPVTGDGSSGSPVTMANATETAAGAQSAADKFALDHVTANWDPTLVRYFLLDYDGGNDANVGYVDAVAGNTLVPAGLAIKTRDRLMQILPPIGNGRRYVLLIKPRAASAVYLDADGITPSVFNFTAIRGYGLQLRRGSTDLTNSATDRVLCGFQTQIAGPNGDGSFTVLAGATTTVFTAAAGSLGAEPAAIPYRVRFKGDVTAGLTNAVVNIQAHTTTQISTGKALGTAPAAGDSFWIEGAGVTCAKWIDAAPEMGIPFFVATTDEPSRADVAIAVNSSAAGAFSFSGGSRVLAGLLSKSNVNDFQFNIQDSVSVALQPQYFDETTTARNVGIGAGVLGAWAMVKVIDLTVAAFGWAKNNASNSTRLRDIALSDGSFEGGIFRQGSYLGSRFRIEALANSGLNPPTIFGGDSAGIPTRSIGGMQVFGACASFQFIDFANCTVACFAASSAAAGLFSALQFTSLTGSSGNLDVGLDLSNLNASVVQTFTCTVSGAVGQIRLVSGVLQAYATYAATNTTDANGNQIMGSAGVQFTESCRVFTNVDGSALALGALVRQSAATQVVRAEADTAPHASGPLWVAVSPPANNAVGLFVPAAAAGQWILHDAAPTVLGLSYVSPGTAGTATTTTPTVGTTQKRRLGTVTAASGNLGFVTGSVDNLPVTSDGNP